MKHGDTKHSPGPWRNIFNWLVKAKDGTIVCDCRSTWHPSGDPKIEQATSAANARLIAAAPDMYEALVKIKFYYDSLDKHPVVPVSELRQLITKVLNKARGDI